MGDSDTGNPVPRTEGCQTAQYLITGVEGFVGREVAAELRARGFAVRGLVRRKKQHVPMPEGVELVTGDVLSPDSLDALFAGTRPQSTVLIHTAALISVRKRDAVCERVNLHGTENILAACKRHGVRRLVHFASVDALPPGPAGSLVREPERFSPDLLPTSYGRSKAAAAQRVLDAAAEGLNCVLLLPSAVIGPGDYRKGFITQMIGVYLSGIPRLSVNGGYEFVDVRDVASAAVAASEKSGCGGCYILSNRYAGVTEIFDLLAEYAGRKKTRHTLPLWTLYLLVPFASAAYRIAGKEPPLTASAVRLMRLHPAYSHEKAARELGFRPRPFERTLADAAEFILAQRKR